MDALHQHKCFTKTIWYEVLFLVSMLQKIFLVLYEKLNTCIFVSLKYESNSVHNNASVKL